MLLRAKKDSISVQERVSELGNEQIMLLEQIKMATKPATFKYLEDEIEKVRNAKAELIASESICS